MEERALSCLLRSRPTMEQDIKASYLMDHMVSDGVLTQDEEDGVLSKATRKEKDNRAYVSFYNALIREGYGTWPACFYTDLPQLSPEGGKSYWTGISPTVQVKLSEGGVPQRPTVFVNRPTLLTQVREKLRRLQNAVGWVTVFGMAGSGKSVLAAEAVRDHALITECFPDGVHWLSVGQCERAELLVRMQSLCFRLEQGQSLEASLRPPGSVEEARERLRFLMLRRFPRCLLILDDIWDINSLRAFDIQCRVLLTTRHRDLTDSVSGLRYSVPVESGLDEEKALEILSLYVNAKPQNLPEQARRIVEECKGSPLVVSLIGALLRDFPDRWGYYLRQLQKKQFQRIRKSSSYDYEALDQAMDASLQVLDDEHRELYKDLSVLEKDVKVPAKVLSVLWSLELEEVEDVLQEFVNKSLLFRDCNRRPYLYYLHDLQLDFLTEQNRAQLPKLHGKVVCQYQRAYTEGPPTSGDEEDLYWYRFLPCHMARAGLSKELCSLMFSLDWVKNKAQLMGSAHLINDYVEYSAILDREFQEFLSLNGPQLEQKPLPDVVQLALSQPCCSEVYRQALLQAQRSASRGQLYLDWVNKSSLESLSRLVVHPQQSSVYHTCFSRDGSKIASCGASSTLRVFKSTSGERLQEIQAHDDEILCCAFSPDDRHIATCSSDRKIKIWNVERGTLIRMFKEEYEEQVNHCQFTNHQRRILLATCSNDKIVNTKVRNTLFGHMEPVNHCCFSPDDAYLATSSNDGSVKLFEVASANEWKTIQVAQYFPESDEETSITVKCSTWSADGARIICAARNTAFVFDVATLGMLLEIRTSRLSTVQYCQACPTSQLLALALSHYTVELWDFEVNKKMAECSGHLSWVHCVQFSPNGSLLLSCSDDQTIRVGPAFSSRSGPLSGQTDVSLTTGDMPHRLMVVSFFPTLTSAIPMQVLETPSGNILATLHGHTKTVHHCLFTDNGQTLITSSEDATLRVWKWMTGECRVLEGHQEPVRKFHLLGGSSSSPMLLSWSFDGTVKVTLSKLHDLKCHEAAILSGDVTPGEHLFSTGSADNSAKVWSCTSWKMEFCLSGHKACVRSCRFSWDDRRLATGDDNGEIRLWSMLDGALLKTCAQNTKDCMDSFHGGWVTDLHFSPDNKVLVSTGGYIKWWSVQRGEALQTFRTTGANLKRIHASPDFKTFVTIDNMGILYILKQVEGRL
uniref:Apoptotic protease-activating factor 1 n=1 Tax=Electrophorus electricus TaxID=8005 RepID=A0AAY5F2U8_ELEEL